MSTADQNGPQLTRKQLRELRLTGSTPVIGEEQREQHEQPSPDAPGEPDAVAEPDAGTEPVAADEADAAADEADAAADEADAAAEQDSAPEPDAAADADASADADAAAAPDAAVAPDAAAGVPDAPAVPEAAAVPHAEPASPVGEPPRSRPLTRREMRDLERARAAASGGDNASAPAGSADAASGTPASDDVAAQTSADPVSEAREAVKSMFEEAASEDPTRDPIIDGLPKFPTAPVLPPASAEEKQASVDEAERPKVGAAFGIGVKPRDDHRMPRAFDELLDTSSGSPKTASTLIFTPSPGVGSLSGPIASTGELLITGSYNLPDGIGSQGHAHGTTDGKDVDAVLIDGELAPSSSPTPIAASSAVSTSKPAGEIIRPAAPDKGGRLTLTLAIIAGGLGLALVTVLIIAFFTNVL